MTARQASADSPRTTRTGSLAVPFPTRTTCSSGSPAARTRRRSRSSSASSPGSATRFPHLRLILVPRHPDRFEEVARLVEQSGLAFARRSRIVDPLPEMPPVVLLDTIGELGAAWGLADVGFTGGSLDGQAWRAEHDRTGRLRSALSCSARTSGTSRMPRRDLWKSEERSRSRTPLRWRSSWRG